MSDTVRLDSIGFILAQQCAHPYTHVHVIRPFHRLADVSNFLLGFSLARFVHKRVHTASGSRGHRTQPTDRKNSVTEMEKKKKSKRNNKPKNASTAFERSALIVGHEM
jgi:hypothetical protein